MSKHTPGPWIAKNATLPNSNVIRWVILEPDNGFILADTGNADTRKSQDMANALLMAAAPELLEFAQNVISLFDRTGHLKKDWAPDAECMNRLREAIVKAEGGSDD